MFTGRNGVPLTVDASGARLGEDVGAGMIFVDGVDIGDPDDVALRDRRALSADGVFIVVATLSSDDGAQVAVPTSTCEARAASPRTTVTPSAGTDAAGDSSPGGRPLAPGSPAVMGRTSTSP